jgi:hypothetical protein
MKYIFRFLRLFGAALLVIGLVKFSFHILILAVFTFIGAAVLNEREIEGEL